MKIVKQIGQTLATWALAAVLIPYFVIFGGPYIDPRKRKD